MQRLLGIVLLVSVWGMSSADAQPMPLNPYYYAPPVQYGPPPSQPAYAPPVESQGPDLGGGFIEFIFSGGQTRHGRPAYQPQPAPPMASQAMMPPIQSDYMYAPPVVQASLPPPEVMIDPQYLKQEVAYAGDEKPGTVIINTPERMLYLIEEDGRALRYGIGVGRPGFTWAGVHEVSAKREWPEWRPPDEMLKRRPELPRWMAGGPENPLGARALYLGSTLYRIHGSNEPWTIGQDVSSGCIRMRNEDVIDLYDRVKIGTKVVVI